MVEVESEFFLVEGKMIWQKFWETEDQHHQSMAVMKELDDEGVRRRRINEQKS